MIVSSDIDSRGIQRVAAALAARPIDADLRVFHVNGRLDGLRRRIEEWGRDYAVVQYCLRSTMRPNTTDWLPVWEAARCVWSYYDLPALCAEDGNPARFDFYHAPLGIEAAFTDDARQPAHRVWRYSACTHGDWLTQTTREVVLAAAPGKVAHLGPPFPGRDPANVDFFDGVTDDALALLYGSCRYVAGLRRVEGFELPAAEGLACGARPILYDRPHYRRWYEDHAVYVAEAPRPDVLAELRDVLGRRPRVTRAEQRWAAGRFDWDVIVRGFHDHL